MKNRLALVSSLIAVLACAFANAQSNKLFPGAAPDQRTMRVQERVEELYASGNYERALLIYQKELSPLGDKYAQYMVGYMHLHAQGVEQNKAQALAWYRLAGERGESILRSASAELAKTMNDNEIAASNEIFAELWHDIGDTKLIMGLIRRDMETLRERTGSRIPGSAVSSPGMIYHVNGEPASLTFYNDVRARLAARLAYLQTKVEVNDLALEIDEADKRLLELEVQQQLSAMGNR